MPWEDESFEYPTDLAHPLNVAIEASNGASDYGNKFGEPVITGFARSFGMKLPGCGERREWIKPIMFSGGVGSMSDNHILKDAPVPGETACRTIATIDNYSSNHEVVIVVTLQLNPTTVVWTCLVMYICELN